MRILHIVHQYPPEYVGGTELYTQSLTQKLTQSGHASAIFTRRDRFLKPQERAEESADLPIYETWHPANPTQRFAATFGNRGMIDDFVVALDHFQPQLIHIQHMMGLPASLLKEIIRRNIPYSISLHDYWWFCANAQLLTNDSQQICDGPRLWLNCTRCAIARSQSKLGWVTAPILPFVLAQRNRYLEPFLQQAYQLIAPTNFVKEWYVEHGCQAEKISVIPLGYDPASISASIQPTHPSGPHPIRIAYIGGLAWQKGLHILIEAFNQVVGDCELWIAGDESFDPDYVGQLRSIASPNVRFLGRLSRAAVWEKLAEVDIVAVPALWYETYSIIIREAFAMKRPVLASRLGALAESVHHEQDGLLIAPGDVEQWRIALQRLVDEPQTIRRFSHQIRQPPTVDEHVSQVMKIYQEMLDS